MAEIQTLTVLEKVRDGFRLSEEVFLPWQEAPEGLVVDDPIEVFVYADSNGEPIATTKTPLAQYGQFAFLTVVGVAPHGAYLDWGLGRDLFVPKKLQHRPLSVGDSAVVAVDVDEHDRPFASSRLAPYFQNGFSKRKIGDEVELMVYGFNELGALCIVDHEFNGLVYRSDTFRELELGQVTKGWVTGLREDGRLDLSVHRSGKKGTTDARDVIWEILERDGFLDLHDKSSPDAIRDRLQMSKKAFKKAVGSLYKERLIRIEGDGIHRI